MRWVRDVLGHRDVEGHLRGPAPRRPRRRPGADARGPPHGRRLPVLPLLRSGGCRAGAQAGAGPRADGLRGREPADLGPLRRERRRTATWGSRSRSSPPSGPRSAPTEGGPAAHTAAG
jgi:hypothetical protein